MKIKRLVVGLSGLILSGLAVAGGIHWRFQYEKQYAAKNVTITHTVWSASRGIFLTFNEPIYSVSWSIQGHSRVNTWPRPITSIWLKTALPQGQKSSIVIQDVETKFKQKVSESWDLSHVLPQPLGVVTNPGPWQLNVSRNGPYSLQFSSAIENKTEISHAVSFIPKLSGRWVWESPTTAEFYPQTPLPSTEQETMVIHSGPTHLDSTSGQYVSSAVSRPFITASNEKIVVQEKLPETLTLYKNGKVIFQSLCNTAVSGAYTPTGSFYIRSKYQYVNMSGVNPNGVAYYDPHVPWVMGLVGNVAIHGFKRATYGFPQSNGCVELPISNAKTLYSMVQVGTPVEILHGS